MTTTTNINEASEAEDITFSDVVEYFESASVNTICQVCGNNGWDLYVGDSLDDTIQSPTIPMGNRHGAFFLGNKGVEMIYAVCQRCANIRFHAKEPIRTWVKNNKPSLKDNGPN